MLGTKSACRSRATAASSASTPGSASALRMLTFSSSSSKTCGRQHRSQARRVSLVR